MPMNQSSGFQDMFRDMFNNMSLMGMGHQLATGRPMIGGNQQNRGMGQQGGMQNPNQLGAASFSSLPEQKGNWWSGYDPYMRTTSPFTGNQQNMMNMLGGMGMQGLQTGQMPGGMNIDPILQQAQTQFNTQTIPSLAERFTSLGGQGGQRSSAFQGALGQAGAGLQENMAAMKSQYMMQMMPMLMQMLGVGLTPQYEQQYMPGKPGLWQSLMPAAGEAAPGALQGIGKGVSAIPSIAAKAPWLAAMFA
jgi:hypothetical protein